MDQKIVPFLFEGDVTVRVIDRDGAPWFVAKDVCEALSVRNPTQAVGALDADERSMFNIGRQGEANCISESGLFTLILRSRQARAEKRRASKKKARARKAAPARQAEVAA